MDPQAYLQQLLRNAQHPQGRVGPQQIAANQAFGEQEAKQLGQFAGMGGQQGAVAAARGQRMAPQMAAKKAQMLTQASGMDAQAAQQAAMAAIQQQFQQEQFDFQKKQAEAQNSPWARLMDLGTKVASVAL